MIAPGGWLMRWTVVAIAVAIGACKSGAAGDGGEEGIGDASADSGDASATVSTSGSASATSSATGDADTADASGDDAPKLDVGFDTEGGSGDSGVPEPTCKVVDDMDAIGD